MRSYEICMSIRKNIVKRYTLSTIYSKLSIIIIIIIMKDKIHTEFKVYGLRVKNTVEFRYIGYTYRTFQKRLSEHYNNKKTNSDKVKWIDDNFGNIEIVLIEGNILKEGIAHNKEIYWIKFYKDLGHRLLNLTTGGQGMTGYKPSKESIEKMLSHPNHTKNNPEWAKNIVAHPNHMKNNPETAKKMVAHPNHFKNNPEARAKVFAHPNYTKNNPEAAKKWLLILTTLKALWILV